ncbi:MAG: two-component system, chemotaxis family, sensor kinase CheA [Micromonosporaceae bacterium]
MAGDPYRYFRIEARELVDQIGQSVLGGEQGPPGPEPMARLMRLAHTLKGAARVVKQPQIAERAHAMEDELQPYRDGAQALPADRVARLLRLVDETAELVAALPPPGAVDPPRPTGVDAAPADGRPAVAPAVAPVVRPDTIDLDELLDAVGEARVRLAPLDRGVATLHRVRRAVELLADQLVAPAPRDEVAARPESGRQRVRSMATQIGADLAALSAVLTRTLEQTDRELHLVRGCAERLRLAPAGTMFAALHRAAHDTAARQGKRVVFETRGGELRLDPQVLSAVHGALVHVVCNAVAHGIEPAADRQARGKPDHGQIVVEVARRGRCVAFAVRDDGRGFDLAAIRRAATAGGHPGTAALGEQDLIGLLLRGGISTAASLSQVSGRGVGLDAVRDVAQRLGGEVAVASEPGLGASVEMVVPLALMALDGLLVEAGGATAVLPLGCVRHAVRLVPDQIVHSASGAAILHDGRAVPFLPLAQALSTPRTPPHHGAPAVAVVLASGATTVAVGVDMVVGVTETVARTVPALAAASPVVAGVVLDSEGNPRLVLDPDGLVGHVGRGAATEAHPATGTPAQPAPVLVIDDSPTTRMLEQSILESAGYQVEVAASAEEALDKARDTRYSLFLVDIEMPGMDGFAFVARTRTDPVLREIPAILVSSRASPEDRARGVQAGACLHVAKNEFNQSELIEHINGLVGRP